LELGTPVTDTTYELELKSVSDFWPAFKRPAATLPSAQPINNLSGEFLGQLMHVTLDVCRNLLQMVFFEHGSSAPILYTNTMLSDCATAILVEHGENATCLTM